MRVLIAPNAYKGTLSAQEAAGIIAGCVEEFHPFASLHVLPIADGGDGTCDLLAEALQLEKIGMWTLDAFGRPIYAYFARDTRSKTLYVDCSSASGIRHLREEERHPFVASTFGTGSLILRGWQEGLTRVVLGLGGSASIDLGIGILQALGFSFLDINGRELLPFSDHLFEKTAYIQRGFFNHKLEFDCLCDVSNPFFGSTGAAAVFGPQKGLDSTRMPEYNAHAKQLIHLLYQKGGKPFADKPGYGAAGGIALGLAAFFETRLHVGASYFFEKVGLDQAVQQSDLILTGEGRFDGQSLGGKACFELLKVAKNYQKKIAIITSGDEVYNFDFDYVMKLPNLNFSDPDLAGIARKNFTRTIREGMLKVAV